MDVGFYYTCQTRMHAMQNTRNNRLRCVEHSHMLCQHGSRRLTSGLRWLLAPSNAEMRESERSRPLATGCHANTNTFVILRVYLSHFPGAGASCATEHEASRSLPGWSWLCRCCRGSLLFRVRARKTHVSHEGCLRLAAAPSAASAAQVLCMELPVWSLECGIIRLDLN